MSTEKDAIPNVLAFWRVVEALSPQQVGKANPDDEHQPSYFVNLDKDLLPWQEGHEHKKHKKGKRWNYVVQCGLYNTEELARKLIKVISSEDSTCDKVREELNALSGDARLFDLCFDEHGNLLPGTFSLALNAWASGVILKTNSQNPLKKLVSGISYDNFEGLKNELNEYVQEGWKNLNKELNTEKKREIENWFEKQEVRKQYVSRRISWLNEQIEKIEKVGQEKTEEMKEMRELRNKLLALKIEIMKRNYIDNNTNENSFIFKCYQDSLELEEIPKKRKRWLSDLIEHTAAQCNLPRELIDGKFILVRAVQFNHQDNEIKAGADDSLINSFFIDDLHKINANTSNALKSYFIEKKEKTDVRKNKDEVKEMLNPEYFPFGCWPSEHPLVFSQQLAVNAIKCEFINRNSSDTNSPSIREGLFGVNGPPGTGKTTLLRDIVAMVVVGRALQLKKLENLPENLFEPEEKSVTVNDQEIKYHPLVQNLRDYSIVVASSNNGAVENISLELPRKTSVHQGIVEGHDYFRDIATRLLNSRKQDRRRQDSNKATKEEAWGLISAALGRKENRRKFIQVLWGQEDASKSVKEENNDTQGEYPPQEVDTGQSPLHQLESLLSQIEPWLMQNQHYQNDNVRRCVIETWNRCFQEIQRESSIDYIILWTRKKLCEEFKNKFIDKLNSLIQNLNNLNSELNKEPKLNHKETAAPATSEENPAGTAETVGSGLCQHLTSLKNGEKKPKISLETALYYFRLAKRNEEALRKLLENEKNKIADSSHPEDEVACEKSKPFFDEAWFVARQKLFLAALNLHRAFIEAYPDKWLNLLQVVRAWLEGRLSSESEKEACQHALDALCFIVPVISTTFASVGRMFSNIQNGGIGWLLIDEAGQAAPQQAVGAIWRARRVIVVGDPLQLEPVVTLPEELEEELAEVFQVENEFRPSCSSVQRLADRASKWGTYINQAQTQSQQTQAQTEKPIWVGCPLRVHRRCDEPMFSISNEIAYGGLMIHDKKEEPCGLPPSSWINVTSSDPNSSQKNNWIEQEGKAFDNLIEVLEQTGADLKNIYVISPFRNVAAKLKNRVRGKSEDSETDHQKGGTARTAQVPENRTTGQNQGQQGQQGQVCKLDLQKIGTVHTAQGKEADIVILVLGGTSDDARKWAAKKPNLLNVAVTRARKRLYVIGGLAKWENLQYFSTMKKRLGKASFTGEEIDWTGENGKTTSPSPEIESEAIWQFHEPNQALRQQPGTYTRPSRTPSWTGNTNPPKLPKDVSSLYRGYPQKPFP